MGRNAYEIELLPSAERQLAKLPQIAQGPVRDAIDALADNPRPAGSDQLAGPDRLIRLERVTIGSSIRFMTSGS